jgi:hypothetical protein
MQGNAKYCAAQAGFQEHRTIVKLVFIMTQLEVTFYVCA